MKITVTSPKYGAHELIIDDSDAEFVKQYGLSLWTSKRHYGFYVLAYNQDTGEQIRLHRLLVGAQKGEIVDHINRNPLDNRRSNLRVVTQLENCQNARKRKDGVTSSFRGVSKQGDRWKAQIQVKGRKKALGIHKTELAAADAYDSYVRDNCLFHTINFPNWLKLKGD